jgi:hypothetical protein
MLGYALRRWIFPGHDSINELIRKDAEIVRKDSEIARKEAQITRLESKVAGIEDESRRSPHAATVPPRDPPPSESLAVRCAQLEAENAQLEQDKKSLEETVEHLKTELAHAAKWLKVFEEGYTRPAESESLAEG